MNINFKQYRDRQFIFAFSFERVPDSSYTGVNTRAGQQMLIKIKPAGATIPCVGYIADDFKTKKMPQEWGNIIFEGKDDYLRMDYGKTTPLLWSALQSALNDIDDLKKK